MTRRKVPLLTVSVAAELAGMHPQTLRQYDRMGLVRAQRTQGGGRRYSLEDVEKLQEVQRLSQEEGISLAGIARIFELQETVADLTQRLERLHERIDYMEQQREAGLRKAQRIFAAGADGNVVLTPNEKALRDYLRRINRRRREEEKVPQKSTSTELMLYPGKDIDDILRLLTKIR